MKKENFKRKSLSVSLKSLAFALGLTAATSTTSFAMPVKETKTIENHEHEHEFDSIDEVVVKMPVTYNNNEVAYKLIAIKEVKNYSIANYKGSSIVEALNLCGIDSSFSNRKVIATNYGIKNYRGTATQNILLLNNLKKNNVKSIVKVSDIEKICKDLFGKNAYRVISDLKLPKTSNITKSEFARIIRNIANYMGVNTSTYDNKLGLVQNVINDVNAETLNNNDIAWSYYMGYTDLDESLNYNGNNLVSIDELNNWIRSFTNDYNTAINNKNYNDAGIVMVPSLDKYERDNSDLSKINEIRNPQSSASNVTENKHHGGSNDHSDNKPVQHTHKYSGWTYLDENKEVSTCNDCGSKKYQRHNLTNNVQTSYQSNENGTHKVTQSAYCNSCHTMINKVSTVNCNLNEWTYNELTGKDERNCDKCEYVEERIHEHNVPTNLEYNYYSSNENGTHKLKATYECSKCHETIELYKDVDCSLSDWTYNSVTGKDERGCNTCGYTETRIHEHNVPTNLQYNYYSSNENGTHKLKASYECNKCHETIELYKDVDCSLGNWTYNHATGKEERSCSICGYTETRIHEHDREPSDLTYTLDGPNYDSTHKLKASYTCNTCSSIITLTKDEDCKYDDDAWTKHDGVSCKNLCIVCEYEKYKNHNFVVDSITGNAILGKHNVINKCDDCDYTKQVEENCTSNGARDYYKDGNIVTVREYCSICNEVCVDDPHTHSYSYTTIDNDQHKKYCECNYYESIEGHSYGELTFNNGKNTRECSECHNVQTIDVEQHICSLRPDIEPPSPGDNYCYLRVTLCEGCDYRRVDEVVQHNYELVEEDEQYKRYECETCGHEYEEVFSSTSFSLRNLSSEQEKIIEEDIIEEEVIEEPIVEEVIEEDIIEEEKGKVLVLK